MNLKKFGILPKILVAIALGILCSFFFPGWAVRVFLTFNSIFGNFLGMFIPLLIIGLVAPGISDLGNGAGKLLLITVALAYGSTVLSGISPTSPVISPIPIFLVTASRRWAIWT
jgi:Na+/H+-dicarboxylate symporter